MVYKLSDFHSPSTVLNHSKISDASILRLRKAFVLSLILKTGHKFSLFPYLLIKLYIQSKRYSDRVKQRDSCYKTFVPSPDQATYMDYELIFL